VTVVLQKAILHARYVKLCELPVYDVHSRNQQSDNTVLLYCPRIFCLCRNMTKQAKKGKSAVGLEPGTENSHGSFGAVEVLGYHMRIAGEELIGDALFSFLEAKKVMVSNMVSCGACPQLYDQNPYGQPWKLHTPMANRLPYAQKDEVEADPSIFRLSEKELRFMTPNLIEPLEAAWEALQMAGIRLDELHRKRVGVFVAGYSPGLPIMSYPDETALRGTLMTSMADQVSYWLGTHGPSVTLDTACASSLTAVTIALNSLRNGSCEVALVIGSTRNSEIYELMLQNAGVVSPKGECKPFDEDASGTIRCEGRACLVLSTSSWAKANHHESICRVLNCVMASAGADPASVVGSGRVPEAPNASGISEMIKLCHEQIGLPCSAIKYFEAHATGTVVGDLVELEAIRTMYGDSLRDVPLKIGSIKGNIGHGESSAGLYGVIKVIEMLRRRRFLPSGGCTVPRRDFDWTNANMEVCQTAEAFPVGSPVCVGVDSFGVGGSYGFAILTESADRKNINSSGGNTATLGSGMPLPVKISAASAEHLERLELDLVQYMKECNPNFVDVCGSMTLNRPHLLVSRNYLVTSMDDFIKQLNGPEKPVMCEGHATAKVAFAFTGQGAQWKNMGDKLMVFKCYREAVEAVDREFQRLAGWSILKAMAVEDPKALESTRLAQPATFTIQVGLCELLKYFGVTPSVVFGHSAGEVPALYCGGYISLHTAVKIVCLRSAAQETLAGCGRMMAINMSRSDIDILLMQNKDNVPNCEVACVNSPHAVVVGGPEDELLFLKRCLPSECRSTLLQGNIAFHTSKMDSILGTLEKKLLKMPLQSELSSLQVPFVSSVTGRLVNDPITQSYFLHNIRQPVQFEKAVESIVHHCEFEMGSVVEIGPHRTLMPLINETLGSMGISPSDVQVVHALQRGEDDCSMIFDLLMKLMNANVAVDMRRFYQDCGYSYTEIMRYSLPVHPILRKSYNQYISRSQASKITYMYDVGPAAGCIDSESPIRTRVQISSATCPLMLDHMMGGNTILPGMYYVEAALEAIRFREEKFNGATLSDVSFDAICPIPDRNKGSNPLVLMVNLSKDIGVPQQFTVVSAENLHSMNENPTVHCTGAVIPQSFFSESGDLHASGTSLDPQGNYLSYELADIGIEGTKCI
jgi:acyl transferase domain-containing protein